MSMSTRFFLSVVRADTEEERSEGYMGRNLYGSQAPTVVQCACVVIYVHVYVNRILLLILLVLLLLVLLVSLLLLKKQLLDGRRLGTRRKTWVTNVKDLLTIALSVHVLTHKQKTKGRLTSDPSEVSLCL